jgi:ABC-type phosphate transport system substrate-binding protein
MSVVAPAWADRKALAVIVNRQCPVTNIDLDTLRRLFLGKRVREEGGRRLVPLNHTAKSDARIRFDEKVLGFDADEAERYWIDQRIRDAARPPRTVSPAPKLVAVVGRLENALSYVPKHDVTREVNVVRVDGKAPGEDGYAINF